MPLSVFTSPPSTVIEPYITYSGTYTDLFILKRTVTIDALLTITFSNLTNNDTQRNNEFWIELVEREEDFSNDSPWTNWNVISQIHWDFTPGQVMTNKTATMEIGERTWSERKQYGIRLLTRRQGNGHSYVTYNVTSAEFSLPKNASTQIKADLKFDEGDYITPKAPENIKQIDFLKGILNLFNMYVYTEQLNPKHVIFEKYDDYYAFTTPELIKSVALDWTKKVDLSSSYSIKPYLALPKSYLFTFKEDNDYINSDYKKKYGEVYGTFKFADTYGITEEKKVELVFSPSPIIQDVGSTKFFLSTYTVDSGNKKLQKSNIRLLFNNGLTPCNEYTIAKDSFISGWQTTDVTTLTSYPMATNYYYVNDLPVHDLHFGRPNEVYFPATVAHSNAETAYTRYYSNQVTELTNPNIKVIECDCVLNEFDINNLDLKTPVFVDMGENGHGYFKVLSVDYISKNHTSRVVLQQIILHTDR